MDQSGENHAVLGFMTHLNQVGQTGSTPRHPKGLSTCCHGRGKADVLYVADAFDVMTRLNALLAKK